MKRTAIEKTVNERISDLAFFALEEEHINPEDSLRHDLGMDSLDQIELYQDLEKTFELSNIAPEQQESLVTVKDVYDLVETLVNLKSNV